MGVLTLERDTSAWIEFDKEYAEWLVQVFVRVSGGVYHLVARYSGEQPSLDFLRHEARRRSCLSKRPYRLGQSCDGSIEACVMALFFNFCAMRNVDAAELRRAARPNRPELTAQEIAAIKEQADWEGTDYPRTWDDNAMRGLVESLHAINAHALAYAVENTMDE